MQILLDQSAACGHESLPVQAVIMKKRERRARQSITRLDPAKPSPVTESGELERPARRRRRIDCGGNPEITDRRAARNGSRRVSDSPDTPAHR